MSAFHLTRNNTMDEVLEFLPTEVKEQFESQLCAIKLLGHPISSSMQTHPGYFDTDFIFRTPTGNVSITFTFTEEDELTEIIVAAIIDKEATRVSSKDTDRDYINTLEVLNQFI